MSHAQPLSRELTNPGHDDRWTCPGCYQDLDTKSEGTFACDNCGRSVECTLDTQPMTRSRLVDESEAEDE